jgi:DNA-binding MarR family transcriptional regulator
MPVLTIEAFVKQISEILPILFRELLQRQIVAIAQGTITPQQILAMEILFHQKGSKMKDLSSSMGVSMATMTGIVGRLVRQGYVVRTLDQTDRRIINAQLTAKGTTLLKKIIDKKRHMFMEIFSQLSVEERSAYLTIITKIKNIVANQKGPA